MTSKKLHNLATTMRTVAGVRRGAEPVKVSAAWMHKMAELITDCAREVDIMEEHPAPREAAE